MDVEDILEELTKVVRICVAGLGDYERKNRSHLLRTKLDEALEKIEYVERKLKE